MWPKLSKKAEKEIDKLVKDESLEEVFACESAYKAHFLISNAASLLQGYKNDEIKKHIPRRFGKLKIDHFSVSDPFLRMLLEQYLEKAATMLKESIAHADKLVEDAEALKEKIVQFRSGGKLTKIEEYIINTFAGFKQGIQAALNAIEYVRKTVRKRFGDWVPGVNDRDEYAAAITKEDVEEELKLQDLLLKKLYFAQEQAGSRGTKLSWLKKLQAQVQLAEKKLAK